MPEQRWRFHPRNFFASLYEETFLFWRLIPGVCTEDSDFGFRFSDAVRSSSMLVVLIFLHFYSILTKL